MVKSDKGMDEVAMLFVGNVVPADPVHENPGFSRAGNLVQLGMLNALVDAGLSALSVVSAPPMASYQNGGRLWQSGGLVSAGARLRIRLFPTLNAVGVKHVWAGLASFLSVICWGWGSRRYRTRVVCAYNLTYPPAVFTIAAARLVGARTVAWLNDVNVPGQTVPSGFRYRLEYAAQRRVAALFNAVIGVSSALLQDFGKGRPCLRIEGGVWNEMLDLGRGRRDVGGDAGPFVMVLAGSLDEANGVRVALEAMSLLPQERFRLVIAGAGPLEAAVRAAAAQDSRIHYRGFIPHGEVLKLYETADLLLNVRLTKALDTRYFFPSKLMEYLASGAPVLTTCTGHVEEEYARVAFLLRDETPAGLAQRLAAIAALPPAQRELVGSEAKQYMQREKTWGKQAHKMFTFVQEHCRGTRTP